MKNFIIKTIVSLFSTASVSCQKEQSGSSGSSSGGDIKGSYTFVSLQAKTRSTNESVSGSDISKTITTSEYTSQNNTGTITIDAGSFRSENIGYSVNTLTRSTYYENGVLIDTFSIPVQFTLPGSSGAVTYKQITADSIYLQSGFISMGGTTQIPQPSGAKIKIENGKLILTSNVSQTTTQTAQGERVTVISEGTSVITLQKK